MKIPKVMILWTVCFFFHSGSFLRAEMYHLLGQTPLSWEPTPGSPGSFDLSTAPGFIEGTPGLNIYYFNQNFSTLQLGDSLQMSANLEILNYGALVSVFAEDPVAFSDGSGAAFLQVEWDSNGLQAGWAFGTFSGGDMYVSEYSSLLSLNQFQIPDPAQDPLGVEFQLTLTLTSATQWQLTGSLSANSFESTTLQGPPIVMNSTILTGVPFYYAIGALDLNGNAGDILVASGSFGVSPIPEPSAGLLLFLAVVMWWLRHGSRNRKGAGSVSYG
jgi:hypothetical protein